jgi:hypothetical protein
VIADLNKEVATLYGMIMPGESKTETSRAVFVIDDKGTPGGITIGLSSALTRPVAVENNLGDRRTHRAGAEPARRCL